MSIPTVVNSASTSGNNQTTMDITLTVSSASDRVLICWASICDAGITSQDVSSVTFDPGGGDEASFTFEQGVSYELTNTWRTEAWYLVLDDGVSNGSYTVRVTYSEAILRASASAWEVTGADTTDPIGANTTATGTSTTPSITLTTTATNSLVGMGENINENTTCTAGSGDTEVTDEPIQYGSQWTGTTPAASTGSYDVSCTSDAGNPKAWTAVGIEILEASGAPPAAEPPPLLALLGVGG